MRVCKVLAGREADKIQQNFASGQGVRFAALRIKKFLGNQAQQYGQSCARADVLSTLDQAAVAGYDVVDRSQSESGALVCFGGEKSFEQMRRGSGIHAATPISHHEKRQP